MVKKYYIKSKNYTKSNKIYSLDSFKKPFCYNEKKKYKIYEYPKFKNKEFWKNKEKNKKPILIVSGPPRNGNHLIISLLDGHSQIIPHPGEDNFLRSLFTYVNINEENTIKKIKKKNHKFFLQLSGQPNYKMNKKNGFDKWKGLFELYNKKQKSSVWSGNQPPEHEEQIIKKHLQDYQDLVPNIDYLKFSKKLKKTKNLVINSFFNFLYHYLEATKCLSNKITRKKKFKYEYRISGSGLRREIFFLMSKIENIKLICPIRNFEGFYFSYAKTMYKLNREFHQKALDDLWEHWKHKVIDYLILKEKYPDNVMIVRYENITANPSKVMKKVSNFLKIKFEKTEIQATLFNNKALGNSSIEKPKSLEGEIFNKKEEKFPPNIILPKEYEDIQKLINKLT
tara:strand:+ start:595 stop:1782 length:1188 start_codon:yes stop_codon:yes gene_type:complete